MTTTSSLETGSPGLSAAHAQLLPALRRLSGTPASPDRVFPHVFRIALEEFEPLVARHDFRSGALTRRDVKHRSSLKRDDAQRLADEYLADPLVEVQCGDGHLPLIASHELGKTLLHTVCVPLLNLHSGDVEGAVGLLIDGSHEKASRVADQLMTLATVAASLRGHRESQAAAESDLSVSTETQLDGFARSGSFGSVREFAYTLVGSLCSRFRCEQVAFGLVTRQRVDVLAVSGLAEIKANSPGVIAVRQAMEECVDRKSVLGWQSDLAETAADGHREEVMTAGLLHRQWAHSSNQSSVLSVPLNHEGRVIGVISFRRDVRQPFSVSERLQMEQLSQRFAAPLQLMEVASRSFLGQLSAAAGQVVRRSMKRGAWGRWAVLLTLLLAAGWFSMGRTQFHPRCACEVVPESIVHFTAPFQGKLVHVYVHAGEEVTAGQLLAEFDTRELRLEFESLVADLTAREVDVRQALRENDVEKAALYQAQADVLRSQALSVESRLRRGRLVAPADGRIIQCDSRELTGQVLAQGNPVLQFAPHGGFVLKVHVPDAIVTSVRAGQTGVFASAARPDVPLPFRIRRVNPAAEVANGANIFVAEADLTKKPEWLKVGMQGNVRIDSSVQPVWWVATHSAIAWLRMRFWL